jgi:sulfite reductase alpha subunit-like flavoprotein
MGIKYRPGDSLVLYPHNEPEVVEEALRVYKLRPDDIISVRPAGENGACARRLFVCSA